jgi:hypothetical protein
VQIVGGGLTSIGRGRHIPNPIALLADSALSAAGLQAGTGDPGGGALLQPLQQIAAALWPKSGCRLPSQLLPQYLIH